MTVIQTTILEAKETEAIEHLFKIAQFHQLLPATKYAALCFLSDRFFERLKKGTSGYVERNISNRRLLPSKSNLKLYAVIAVWISSKVHEAKPIRIRTIKDLCDMSLRDQLYTEGDLAEAEIVFLKTIDFELQTGTIAYFYLEDLLANLQDVCDFAKGVNLETCSNILDLLYENPQYRGCEEDSDYAAAAILAAAYYICLPDPLTSNFAIFRWLEEVCMINQRELQPLVEAVLNWSLTESPHPDSPLYIEYRQGWRAGHSPQVKRSR